MAAGAGAGEPGGAAVPECISRAGREELEVL